MYSGTVNKIDLIYHNAGIVKLITIKEMIRKHKTRTNEHSIIVF